MIHWRENVVESFLFEIEEDEEEEERTRDEK
jgi:hypothetical protein